MSKVLIIGSGGREHAIIWAGRLDAEALANAAEGLGVQVDLAPVVDLAEWLAKR